MTVRRFGTPSQEAHSLPPLPAIPPRPRAGSPPSQRSLAEAGPGTGGAVVWAHGGKRRSLTRIWDFGIVSQKQSCPSQRRQRGAQSTPRCSRSSYGLAERPCSGGEGLWGRVTIGNRICPNLDFKGVYRADRGSAGGVVAKCLTVTRSLTRSERPSRAITTTGRPPSEAPIGGPC